MRKIRAFSAVSSSTSSSIRSERHQPAPASEKRGPYISRGSWASACTVHRVPPGTAPKLKLGVSCRPLPDNKSLAPPPQQRKSVNTATPRAPRVPYSVPHGAPATPASARPSARKTVRCDAARVCGPSRAPGYIRGTRREALQLPQRVFIRLMRTSATVTPTLGCHLASSPGSCSRNRSRYHRLRSVFRSSAGVPGRMRSAIVVEFVTRTAGGKSCSIAFSR